MTLMSMEKGEYHLLTVNQRKIVGSALASLGLVTITAVIVMIFLLMRAFISEFAIVIGPLAVAGILALILQPVVKFMQRRLGFTRLISVLVLYVMVILGLGITLYLTLPILSQQLTEFIHAVPQILQSALNFVEDKFPRVGAFLREQIRTVEVDDAKEQLRAVAGPAATSLMAVLDQLRIWAVEVGASITAIGIVPVYLFFFLLMDRAPTSDLSRHLDFLREDWRRDVVFLVRMFVQNIEAFFRGQILIALIMGVLYAVGFSISGLSFGFILGLALGFLNIVPYLGSIIGLATTIPIAYLQPDGGMETVVWVLSVFTLVQLIEGWILTPRIMGNMTGLHPVAVIFGIFFWGVAFDGILGMILAIPLTAFLIAGWQFVFRRYLNKMLNAAAKNAEEERVANEDNGAPA